LSSSRPIQQGEEKNTIMNFVEKLQEEEGVGGLVFSQSKITQLIEIETEKAQEKDKKKGTKLTKQWTTFYESNGESLSIVVKERDSPHRQLGRNDAALRPQTEKQPRETLQSNLKPSRNKSKQPTRQGMVDVESGHWRGGMHA
jgi:hypothetical protein